jgi:hypothetical protein
MDACMPALRANGFAVLQPIGYDERGDFVETQILHESGHAFTTRVHLILGKNDMQGFKSAVTYARRIGLGSLAGVSDTDDDGNAAAKAAPKRQPIEDQRVAFRQSLEPPHDPETGEVVTEPRDHSITTDEDSANLASWKDGVLDRLPVGATTPEKAKALLVQFLEDLDKYKAENWLEKYIASRRPVTEWMGQFADLKPVLVNSIARARARVRGEDTRDFADISERMVATGNVGG